MSASIASRKESNHLSTYDDSTSTSSSDAESYMEKPARSKISSGSSSVISSKIGSSQMDAARDTILDGLLDQITNKQLWFIKICTFLNGFTSILIYNTCLNAVNPIQSYLFPGLNWASSWGTSCTVGAIIAIIPTIVLAAPVSLKLMRVCGCSVVIGLGLFLLVIGLYVDFDSPIDAGVVDTDKAKACEVIVAVILVFAAMGGQYLQMCSYSVAGWYNKDGGITLYQALGEGASGLFPWFLLLTVGLFPETKEGVFSGVCMMVAVSMFMTILNMILLFIAFPKNTVVMEVYEHVNPTPLLFKRPEETNTDYGSFRSSIVESWVVVVGLILVLFGTCSMFANIAPYSLDNTFDQNNILLGIFLVLDFVMRFSGFVLDRIRLNMTIFYILIFVRIAFHWTVTLIPMIRPHETFLSEMWAQSVVMVILVCGQAILFTCAAVHMTRVVSKGNVPRIGTLLGIAVQLGVFTGVSISGFLTNLMP